MHCSLNIFTLFQLNLKHPMVKIYKMSEMIPIFCLNLYYCVQKWSGLLFFECRTKQFLWFAVDNNVDRCSSSKYPNFHRKNPKYSEEIRSFVKVVWVVRRSSITWPLLNQNEGPILAIWMFVTGNRPRSQI